MNICNWYECKCCCMLILSVYLGNGDELWMVSGVMFYFCHLASGGNSWNSGGQKNSFSKNGTCISSTTRLFIEWVMYNTNKLFVVSRQWGKFLEQWRRRRRIWGKRWKQRWILDNKNITVILECSCTCERSESLLSALVMCMHIWSLKVQTKVCVSTQNKKWTKAFITRKQTQCSKHGAAS